MVLPWGGGSWKKPPLLNLLETMGAFGSREEVLAVPSNSNEFLGEPVAFQMRNFAGIEVTKI